MSTSATLFPKVEEERYLALLRAANAIATCSDCDGATGMLVKKLREVTPFDSLQLVAFERDSTAPAWSLLEAHGKKVVFATEPSLLEGSPIEWVHSSGEPLVIKDWSREARFPKYGVYLN